MVLISCFRPSRKALLEDSPTPARPKPRPTSKSATKSSFPMRRHGSADSRSSTYSNESISKLPPCSGLCDPRVDAMMMPIPDEARQSRCLRLSQPKTYSNIVDSMKKCKGCRDWRNFNVFEDDDVDMSLSADEVARKRAASYERKCRELNSFSSDEATTPTLTVNLP